MANLYNVDSPINREQRNNINDTFTDILYRFSSIQSQINILAGGEEIDVILKRIEDAVEKAQTDVAAAVAEVSTALGELSTVVSNASAATQDAINAKNATLQATQDAQTAITQMQGLINNLKSRGAWSSTTAYKTNNLAEVDGKTYIALLDHTNKPVTDTNYWSVFADKGEKGDRGLKGDTGAALSIKGKLTDESQLPSTGAAGDAYTINGELWVWSDNTSSWENVGNIKGEKGDEGQKGDKGDKGDLGSLTKYEYTIPATSNGQTSVTVPLSTLSIDDDVLVVLNGIVLYNVEDYTINGSVITLKQPITDASTSTFYVRVLKSIPSNGSIPTGDGSLITDGTVSKQKLTTDVRDALDSVTTLDTKVTTLDTKVTTLDTKVTTHLDDFVLHTPYVVSTGTSTLYEVDLGSSVTALTEGMSFAVKFHVVNDRFPKLKVNGLTEKTIANLAGSQIETRAIFKDAIYTVRYSGTFFYLQGGGILLNDTLTSTSKFDAATANAVKMVNDKILSGTTDPNGQITATIGTLYVRTSGNTATTTLYVKTSGVGNTGWTAK